MIKSINNNKLFKNIAYIYLIISILLVNFTLSENQTIENTKPKITVFETNSKLIKIVIGSFYILLGIISSFFGKKLFRFIMIFISFLLIFRLLSLILNNFNSYSHKTVFWISFGVSIILGISSFFIRMIGRILLGITVGDIISNIIISVIKTENKIANIIILVICVLIGIFFGVLLNKTFIIFGTSFVGSFIFMSGLDEYFDKNLSHFDVFKFRNPDWKVWLIISISSFLFSISLLFQTFCLKSKNPKGFEKL